MGLGKRWRPVAAACAAATALMLGGVGTARASFHLEKVNEVMLASGTGDSAVQFIELFDPASEPFPPQAYALHVYDAAGTSVGEEPLSASGMAAASSVRPYLVSTAAADSTLGVSGDEVLTIQLPAAGQACYEASLSKVSCISWGTITAPVQSGAPNAPAPPNGESLQRQSDDTLQHATPTPKAANTDPRTPAPPGNSGPGSGTPPSGTPPGSGSNNPGGGGSQTTPVPFKGAGLGTKSSKVRHGKVAIRLRCPAGSGGCSGRIALTARLKGRTLKLGHATFQIPEGAKRSVRVKISRAGRRLLTARSRLRAGVRIAARSGTGERKSTTGKLLLILAAP